MPAVSYMSHFSRCDIPPFSHLCTALMLNPQRPSHILTVFRPSIPGKESNELEILQLLNTFQPKSEHIISLLDSFQTQSTSWAILPKMESVAAYVVVAPNQLYGKVAQVCWGLIRGIAYLHEICIAHSDIKPSNLVVDQGFCLKIIDFDLAMQVKDEDEEVNDQCGTKHWMAPEIEKKLAYSPIKADRWSSGRVILYLLHELKKEDELLRAIGRKLAAHSPKQRPSMDEVAATPLDMPNIARKKTLRSWQPKMKMDRENAKPPKAKKQRLR
jgi:serine/threonine protein kinase